MNGEELLRMIDLIHTTKDIPKEVLFRALEEALAAGVRKRLGLGEDLVVTLDRNTGEVTTEDNLNSDPTPKVIRDPHQTLPARSAYRKSITVTWRSSVSVS